MPVPGQPHKTHRFTHILLAGLFLVAGLFSSQAQAGAADKGSYQVFLKHYDSLLEKHVAPVSGADIKYNGVNYNGWARNPAHDKALKALKKVDPAQFDTQHSKLVFWINAYNFLTIDLIVDKGERESIKNLGGLFSSPWTKYEWQISDNKYTLDQIEHEIIRPMGEPRIHFAINCAAKSCPDLRGQAYRADRFDNQLDEQVAITLNNATKGLRQGENNVIYVTKVMDWFRGDFKDGNLKSWLARYRTDLIDDKTSIQFLDYDWSLNKQITNKDS